MHPVVASLSVACSREEIFEYLSDVANYAEFTDHFLDDLRLTREISSGRGAGLRFHFKAPLRRYAWCDLTLVELEEPFRITAVGRGGKTNRVRLILCFTITTVAAGMSEVEISLETEPATFADQIFEPFGSRRWINRKLQKAAKRLHRRLEGDSSQQAFKGRLTVAGS